MTGLSRITRPFMNLIRERPLVAVFEVCLRCNSSCGYCDLPLNEGRYEMTREEIRRVFISLYEDGLRFLFIQGGEPLVRKDLPEILEDLVAIGYSVTMITNGTLLKPSIVSRLAALPLNLSVSLDTLNQKRYAHIRGADQLPLVLEGIRCLKDYPHPKYLTCIVSEGNQEDVIDVVRFAREKGFIPIVGAYHWDIGRYGKKDLTLQYQRTTAIKTFETVLESGLMPRGYFRQYLRDNIQWLKGKSLNPCDAGRYSIAIDASGNVAPCLAHESAGNLLETSLATILDQFDRERIRTCSDHSSCNLLCSRLVGSFLRHPLSIARTPTQVNPRKEAYAGHA